MASHNDEIRRECRLRFEGGESIKSIHRSTKISRVTLAKWRMDEGWIVPPDMPRCIPDRVQIEKDVKSNVISFATKKTVEKMAESGAMEQHADLIEASLAMHGQISATMLRNAYGMMLKFEAGHIQPGIHQSECDVFNALITGVTKAVAASRDIGGLKPGDISSIQKQVQDKAIEIKIQPYAPQPLILDADGRATDAA